MFEFHSGSPLPLGASATCDGVNFSIFSRNATAVSILIYEDAEDEMPIIKYELDSRVNQTGDIWHCFVKGARAGQWYGYFIDGDYDPKSGKRFNANKLLLDPYAKAIRIREPLNTAEMFGYDKTSKLEDLSFSKIRSDRTAPKACIIKNTPEQIVRHRRRKLKDHIIYEMHVKGFTVNPNSGVSSPGTFKGIIDKIPYLQDLGVTAVELLPIHAYDDKAVLRYAPDGTPLTNYWGYDPIAFSALHEAYCANKAPHGAIEEFKSMVNEFHKADIDVILDVVFNHTGEGNELGPTVSFKGVDNSMYYMLENGRHYRNYTGCGNTMNCAHSVVRELIVDSLVHWVVEMGVDGFRFDLASVFSRDAEGNLIQNAPLVEKIAENPILRDVIIIAESWDAAGAYQVGRFGGYRWAEWNGAFRDDIRSFIKADLGSLKSVIERITGSPAMFLTSSKFPANSINFVTCHDGFTLKDLVSYNEKHNLENGEENKDGYNDNRSWNCGVEGETSNPEIIKLRKKQMKNSLALLMVSLGVPMISAGDEFCRTQLGNNNAYCQNNEISWLDWSLLEKNKDFFRFVKNIITFRKQNSALRRRHFYYVPEEIDMDKFRDLVWFNEKGDEPDWQPDLYHVAFLIKGWTPIEGSIEKNNQDFFIILNSHWEPHTYVLPKIKGKRWYFVCDTDKESPDDIVEFGKSSLLENQNDYTVQARSVAIFTSKLDPKFGRRSS